MKILVTTMADVSRCAHLSIHEYLSHLNTNHELKVISVNDWWKEGKIDYSLYTAGFERMLQSLTLTYLTHRRISPVLQELLSPFSMGQRLREVSYRSFDVHLDYTTLLSGYLAARKLGAAGIPTVYFVGDDATEMARMSPQIPAPLRPLAGLMGRALLSRNIQIPERVVFINEVLWQRYPQAKAKSEVLTNGVNVDLFRPRPSAELRQRLGLEGAFLVGYVGVLREWVDLEPFFAALREARGRELAVKALIVGEEGAFEETQRLARSYGVADRMVFTGTVPYHEMPTYISAMDLCLIPFKACPVTDRALPLKPFEYTACEKPVVSAPTAGVVEAASERVRYVSNAEEYLEAVNTFSANPELGERMGRAGREFVAQKHSWHGIACRMEQILEEVAQGG